jgi:hypothetical protein
VNKNPLAINDIPAGILTSEMCLIATKDDSEWCEYWVTNELQAKIKRALNGEVF